MSNINYCSSIWSESTVYTKKLEVAQKRAMRIISNAKYNQHTQPLFAKSRTLTLEHQFELNLLKLGNSIISKQEPEPILEVFTLKEKSKTRSGDKILFYEPKADKISEKRFPQYRLPIVWRKSTYNDQLKLLKKPATLANSYKNYRIMEYSYFKCRLTKCYPCGRH